MREEVDVNDGHQVGQPCFPWQPFPANLCSPTIHAASGGRNVDTSVVPISILHGVDV
jgi:hypothetical protein